MQSKKTRKRTTTKRKHVNPLFAWVIILVVALVAFFASRYTYDEAMDWYYPCEYSEIVEEWAEYYEVDEMLVYAHIHTESGFDPDAVSNVGARGLMQITSDTFDWIKSKIARDEELTFEDLFTPEVNIRFGTYYLSECLKRYNGDQPTAAAAYHSGWGTVDALLEKTAYSEDAEVLSVFPYEQMQNYVLKIAKSYQKYQELYGSKNQ